MPVLPLLTSRDVFDAQSFSAISQRLWICWIADKSCKHILYCDHGYSTPERLGDTASECFSGIPNRLIGSRQQENKRSLIRVRDMPEIPHQLIVGKEFRGFQ
jgi:hypothetical protein